MSAQNDPGLKRRDFVRLCAAAPVGASLAMTGPTSAADAPASPRTWREPARDVPVMAEYDVLVCGGGPAGCAAAIAAARLGTKTLLVEKDGYLGGTTVSQLVVPILSTNGVDFQGVWHEWIAALRRRGGVSDLTRYRKTARNVEVEWFEGSVDPEMVKFAWDELLSAAGADILHHVLIAGAILEDGGIRGVLAETRAGRRAILARRVIDSTGDGAVCAAAGVPWEQGAEGKPWAMAVTKNFRVGNIPDFDKVKPGLASGVFGRSIGRRPEALGGIPLYKVNPLDPWDLTRAERDGRAAARRAVESRRKDPKFKDIYLVDTSSHVGVRSSRRIRGIAVATAADAMELRKYPDGIARASWEIDIHTPEAGAANLAPWDTPDYRRRMERTRAGDYFDIRFGCIVAAGVDNLLVAGRCLSAEHIAQAGLRIQQTCQATGQAAGTAAALSLKENVMPRVLDPKKVVEQLAKDRAAVEPAFESLKGLG